MIELKFDPEKGIWCEDLESLDKLKKNFFGEEKDGKIFLNIEEALYVLDLLNGRATQGETQISFNELASHFSKDNPRLIIKYNAYRDWRDRGLILKREKDV